MQRIDDCISFLVGKAAQQIARRARERLAGFGVTPVQYAVLWVLWRDDGRSSAEICARLVIDSATITGVIDRLEAAGLVARRADPADRRVNRVFLSDRGRGLQAGLDAAMQALNADVMGELGAAAPAVWSGLRRLGEVA